MRLKEVIVKQSEYGEELEKDQVEIGFDGDGLYFDAGSEAAFYAFLRILLTGPHEAIAYLETRIVSYEEVEVEESKTEKTQGLLTNRIELIHMITDFIETSDIRLIEDRDAAAMLAVNIVDGLEDEAERRRSREVATTPTEPLICPSCGARIEGSMFSEVAEVAGEILMTCPVCKFEEALWRFREVAVSPAVPIKCPECEAVQEGSEFLGLANQSQITCRACDHVAPIGEFRKETPGYGGGSE